MSLHVAIGATIGACTRSRLAAFALGSGSHVAADAVPHRDFSSRPFELASGVTGVALLAVRRGPFDPATLGAVGAALPDLEHVVRLPRPGGSKLLHGRRGWHRSGSFRPEVQLLLAGALVYRLLFPNESPNVPLDPPRSGVASRG